MRLLNIRAKLLGAFVAVVLIPVLTLAVGIRLVLGLFYDSRQTYDTGQLDGMARAIAGRVERVLASSGEGAALDVAGDEVAAAPSDLKVLLVDTGGRILASNREEAGSSLSLEQIMTMTLGAQVRGQEGFYYAREVVTYPNGSPWAGLFIGADLAQMRVVMLGGGRKQDLVGGWILSSAAVGGVLLSLSLFWVLGKHLVHPLQQISSAVRRVALGDLNVHLDLTRKDEIGDLARDIDTMIRHIRESRNRVEALERSRRYWVAGASHDLRSPLTALKGHLELLMAGTSADQAFSLAAALSAANQLDQLVNDLFELARIDAGADRWQFVETDLVELLRREVIHALPHIRSRGLELDLDLPEERVMVQAASGKIERVVQNLLNNAIKYGSCGGWLGVRVTANGKQAVVAVADRGPGIEPNEAERLFERFNRGNPARRQAVEGTGLGLALAREIVERHGGKIWVTSGVEGGAEFAFSLPLCPAPDSTALLT